MLKKRILTYGTIIGGSLAAYYREELMNVSMGAVRFGRTAYTVGQIVVDYNRSLYSKNLNLSPEEEDHVRSAVHLRSARRLLRLCEVNGGAYIKVGQHLGALDYLLPSEYVRTMRVLHSHAPQSKFQDILNVLNQDLQCEPLEVFESIDPTPLGTASLAQVHKAKLISGEVVAVKVQHPLVKTYSRVDMKSMELLAHAVAWFFPDFKLMWLVKETKRNLPCELDFTMEAQNAEKAAELYSHLRWLHVPKIYWNYTTPRVLTMEYCNGINVGDLSEASDSALWSFRREISRKITQLYSDMIFLHGYVHCDPHPGNIRLELNSHGKLVLHLLDHGLYTKLNENFRETYSQLWLSIIRSNIKEIESYANKLGVGELFGLFACMVSGRSWNAILKGIDKQQKSLDEEKEIKDDAAKYMIEITEVLHRVPREMLLIFKTNDLLRGLDYMLGIKGNKSSFVTMSKSCAQANFYKEYHSGSSVVSKCNAVLSYFMTRLRITIYQIYLCWFV